MIFNNNIVFKMWFVPYIVDNVIHVHRKVK